MAAVRDDRHPGADVDGPSEAVDNARVVDGRRQCDRPGAAQTLRAFIWNLAFTGGLAALSSLFAVNRFPLGYLVPWITFAVYGASLGTDSFVCPTPDGPLSPSLAVLWTRAGFREITGYMLIAAALANRYLWQQPSFFSLKLERIRSWKQARPNLDLLVGLCAAASLIAWGAVVEMMP
jgi:hypothetical protein